MRRVVSFFIFACIILAIAGCGATDIQVERPIDPARPADSIEPSGSFDSSGSVDSDSSDGSSNSHDVTGSLNTSDASGSNPSDFADHSGASDDSSSPDTSSSPGSSGSPDSPGSPGSPGSPHTSASHDNDEWRIKVTTAEGAELWSFTETTLKHLSPERAGAFAHAYSTINNWPTTRFYAADGYRVESILLAAEALDIAQTVTFRAADGYEVSLTREQLLAEQYYFPKAGEGDSGALRVAPIIAYRWRESTDNLNEIRSDPPILIFGQSNPFEHTNPAFIEDLVEIIVNDAPSTAWPAAGTFPLPGQIPEGETVKLQHPDFGLVKLHYTLDGSDPTPLSPMYNPSTYQLELNKPIPITEPTTIKVLVTGFGKSNSEIAVFEFVPIR